MIPFYDIYEMGEAGQHVAYMQLQNQNYWASRGVGNYTGSADALVSRSINAVAEGTKEGVVATARGYVAYQTGGLSEAAITSYQVSQAKTVTEKERLLWNNAKNQTLLVIRSSDQQAEMTRHVIGQESKLPLVMKDR